MGMTIATSLLEAFGVLPDPCLARGKEHRWSERLFIAVCTLLTGGESFYDMEDFAAMREEWLHTFLALPGGPPMGSEFKCFNPRPREGATRDAGKVAVGVGVSIHAPVRERPKIRCRQAGLPGFQSTPP